MADDANACVCIGPEPGTVGAGTGVPGEELGSGDAVRFGYVLTAIATLDIVERIAVGNDTGL